MKSEVDAVNKIFDYIENNKEFETQIREEIIKAIAKIQSQSTSNPTSISQAAAVEALNGTQDFIKERANSFRERRDFVVNSLNNINGISCLRPEGAF